MTLVADHRLSQLSHEDTEVQAGLNGELGVLTVGLLVLVEKGVNRVNVVMERLEQEMLVGLVLLLDLMVQLEVKAMAGLAGGVDNALAKSALLGQELEDAHDGQAGQIALLHAAELLLALVGALSDEGHELLDEVADGLDVDAAEAADDYLAEVVAVAFEEGHDRFEEGGGGAEGGVELGGGLVDGEVDVDGGGVGGVGGGEGDVVGQCGGLGLGWVVGGGDTRAADC